MKYCKCALPHVTRVGKTLKDSKLICLDCGKDIKPKHEKKDTD